MKKITPASVEPVYRTIAPPPPALYRVVRRDGLPARLGLDPAAGPWADLPVAAVADFHPKSTDHRPRTEARLLHDGSTLHVLFDVQDRYVRCVHLDYQSMVSRDSCVELFLQPPGSTGYFNFEFNCAGTLLLYFIEDPARAGRQLFRKYTPVPPEVGGLVKVRSSLSAPIDPERGEPVRWQLAVAIPISVMTPSVPGLRAFDGDWRGNLFKCADDTSHPHWAAWNPIGSVLRFHQPDRFGTIRFE